MIFFFPYIRNFEPQSSQHIFLIQNNSNSFYQAALFSVGSVDFNSRSPFQAGYVGEDVESILYKLLQVLIYFFPLMSRLLSKSFLKIFGLLSSKAVFGPRYAESNGFWITGSSSWNASNYFCIVITKFLKVQKSKFWLKSFNHLFWVHRVLGRWTLRSKKGTAVVQLI